MPTPRCQTEARRLRYWQYRHAGAVNASIASVVSVLCFAMPCSAQVTPAPPSTAGSSGINGGVEGVEDPDRMPGFTYRRANWDIGDERYAAELASDPERWVLILAALAHDDPELMPLLPETRARFALGDPSAAQVALGLSPSGEAAYRFLRHALVFAFGPTGFVGLAPQPHAVAVLAREKRAADAFRLLLKEAPFREGQLYALCGLEQVDRAAFERAVVPCLSLRDAKNPRESVRHLDGCISDTVSVAEIARGIYLGWYDPASTQAQRVAFAAKLTKLTKLTKLAAGAAPTQAPPAPLGPVGQAAAGRKP
jgi:hypothetical protein